MSYKIFVSYKYADKLVYQDTKIKHTNNIWDAYEELTPRHYLNALSDVLSDIAIEKWEPDGEDLSQFTNETIKSRLRDMIYDSSITLVLVSPGMRVAWQKEKDQWIPWEVSYSLRESTRNGRTSKANALLAVVLPDRSGSYTYCIEKEACGAHTLKFNAPFCFTIIGKNFFNNKHKNQYFCEVCNTNHYRGDDSGYIIYATWKDFITQPEKYIKKALHNRGNIDEFNICKTV